MLARFLARAWWVLLVRGLLSVTFGLLAFLKPGVTLAALVLLFGGFALADGVVSVIGAFGGRDGDSPWWLMLLEGLVGIGVGGLTLFAPGVTTVAVLFYIAIWAVATGVLKVVGALWLRKEIEGEWLLVLSGLASVAFGVLVMARPADGALAILWLIASFAVAFGLLLVFLAFKARGFGERVESFRESLQGS